MGFSQFEKKYRKWKKKFVEGTATVSKTTTGSIKFRYMRPSNVTMYANAARWMKNYFWENCRHVCIEKKWDSSQFTHRTNAHWQCRLKCWNGTCEQTNYTDEHGIASVDIASLIEFVEENNGSWLSSTPANACSILCTIRLYLALTSWCVVDCIIYYIHRIPYRLLHWSCTEIRRVHKVISFSRSLPPPLSLSPRLHLSVYFVYN